MKLVMNDEIKVFRMKKADILSQMNEQGFKPQVHDILLHIPLYDFTLEKYEKLEKQKMESKSKLEAMQTQTKQSLWNSDLEELIV
jgi:hypothetical protein